MNLGVTGLAGGASKIWHAFPDVDELNAGAGRTLVSHLGIKVTEIGPDFLRGSMPVDERTHQPFGVLHGGASVALAETIGSTAANLCIDDSLFRALGQEINANHIRPVSSGQVFGTARPFHIGKTSQIWHVEIRDERERLVCVCRLTMAVVKIK